MPIFHGFEFRQLVIRLQSFRLFISKPLLHVHACPGIFHLINQTYGIFITSKTKEQVARPTTCSLILYFIYDQITLLLIIRFSSGNKFSLTIHNTDKKMDANQLFTPLSTIED
ncbi:hypothetical protein DMA11_06470 [Marinilabiliaceae bacterium JC017]|nr:hypothetical protein DMA11_06470 [Marinilabiliaceae bacterium JC017]